MSLFTPQHQPLTLRPYQREAIDAVYRHLREHDDNPCVVIPTAGGKSAILAAISSDAVSLWGGRVLVVAHVKELLEQNYEKLHAICPGIDAGLYSASLGRRDTKHAVVVAGVQSIYQRAVELGRFDLIIVDECHLLNPEGDGMYRRLITDARALSPHLRVIGFTATPFRLSSGPICQPPPEGIVNTICYEVGIRELIADHYLSPLRSKAGRQKVDTSNLHQRGGEFVAGEVEALMDQDALVRAACIEIVEQVKAHGRKSVLIFASGVSHGRHVAEAIETIAGVECGFLDGETPTLHREGLIRRFREGTLKYLCNVNVLTTGFDAPNIDCIAMLRPTASPGLLIQALGRGTRLFPGKTDCLVLDFGGNIMRHGPIDQIRGVDEPRSGEAPAKECPQCQALIATGYTICPDCGHVFTTRSKPPATPHHDIEAAVTGVMSGEVAVNEFKVRRVSYSVHTKRDAPPEAPKTLRVDYEIGFHSYQSEWVCVEHPVGSYAQQKACEWWRKRSRAPMPDMAEDAVAMAVAGALAGALSITVKNVAGEKYDRIVEYELDEVPPWGDVGDSYDSDLSYKPIQDSDLPF